MPRANMTARDGWVHTRTAIAVFKKLAGKVERQVAVPGSLWSFTPDYCYGIDFGDREAWLRGHA